MRLQSLLFANMLHVPPIYKKKEIKTLNLDVTRFLGLMPLKKKHYLPSSCDVGSSDLKRGTDT